MFQFWVAVESSKTNQICLENKTEHSDSKASLYKYNALNNDNYNYKLYKKTYLY